MKNGKKPTREQRKFLEKKGIDSRSVLIERDMPNEMVIIDRTSDEVKHIAKD